jgi:hypothetical protein
LIDSGTGTIYIDGYSQTSGSSYSSGVYFKTDNPFTIKSANTTADAIKVIAKATGTSGEAWGIEHENSVLSILATGTGGGITINTSQKLSYETFFRTEINVLAKSGPITMTANYDGLGVGNGYWYEAAYSYWGSKAGVTGLTTSTSNITIAVDNVDWQSSLTPSFATTGTLEVKPTSTSFSRTMSSSWFPMNQNGQTISGFTLGKLATQQDFMLIQL